MIWRMSDENGTSYGEGGAACPFLAFDDDRDHRADYSDSRHRCYATAEPEPLDTSHQERYCLSVAFAACPVFLEWARAEAAGVAGGAAPAPSGKGSRTPADTPPFPGGRGRTTPAEASRVTPHAADPGSGLWGFEGAPKRTVAPAVTPPITLPGAATTAPPASKRQVTKPAWENPPRYDNFPRLRPRDDRSGNQTLLLAVIGVAAVFVLLILGPLFAPKGSSASPSPSLVADSSPSASESATPTPESGQTFTIYEVKRGDTLRSIAAAKGITYEQLLAANPQITNPNHIEVGQVIYIPWQTWVPPASPTEESSSTPLPIGTPTA
jgi:LysM repeat protein